MPEKDPKEKYCHRFMIPAVWQEPKEVPAMPEIFKGAQPGGLMFETKTALQFVACLKSKCVMFDEATGECWEVREKKATVLLAEHVGHMEEMSRAGEA